MNPAVPALLASDELAPGELRFVDCRTPAPRRMATLLGSCVAVTIWHPRLKVGGMCHCLLPARNRPGQPDALDGRYLDEALQWLAESARRLGKPSDFVVKLVGGGRLLQERDGVDPVGARNVARAERLIARHGFVLAGRHVGGSGHRRMWFDLDSGEVWVRHHRPSSFS